MFTPVESLTIKIQSHLHEEQKYYDRLTCGQPSLPPSLKLRWSKKATEVKESYGCQSAHLPAIEGSCPVLSSGNKTSPYSRAVRLSNNLVLFKFNFCHSSIFKILRYCLVVWEMHITARQYGEVVLPDAIPADHLSLF